MRASSIHILRYRALNLGRWFVIASIFFEPISKPPTNIFLFLALACAIIGVNSAERFREALRHPVVLGALAWFAILLLSGLHPEAPATAWSTLGSYKTFLYPVFIVALLDSKQWRNRALLAFAASAGMILIASWSQFLANTLFGLHWGNEGINSYVLFKDYTQQGLLFLVFSALCAAFALHETQPGRRRLYWIAAVLAMVNVIFVLQSRTSYLVVAPLLLYALWRLAGGWRGLSVGVLALAVLATASWYTPRIQQRLMQSYTEITQYSQNREATSLGIRLEIWKRTLQIIGDAPWFGHGLASWPEQFNARARDLPPSSGFRMGHPHQEYLLIFAEQGLVGLAAYISLLLLLLIYIRRLDAPYRDFFTCLLLIYIAAGLANCLMADFTHRHRFLLLLACIPPLLRQGRETDQYAATR